MNTSLKINNTKMTVSTYTPIVTNMSIQADEARIAIISDSQAFTSNTSNAPTSNDIFYIGTTTANRDAYIAIDDNTNIKYLADFGSTSTSLNASVKIGGHIIPTSNNAYDLSGWQNLYLSGCNIYFGNQAQIHYDTSNEELSFQHINSNNYPNYLTLKGKNISLISDDGSKTTFTVVGNATKITTYDAEEFLVKTFNFSSFSSADVIEGYSNLYFTEDRVKEAIDNANIESSSISVNMSNSLVNIVKQSSNTFIKDISFIDKSTPQYVIQIQIPLNCNLQNDHNNHMNYVKTTSNTLNAKINTTFPIFRPQFTAISSNASNYFNDTSNNILQISTASSNTSLEYLRNCNLSTSNYVLSASNMIANFLINTSNDIYSILQVSYDNISNQIMITSNELHNVSVDNSNAMVITVSSADANSSQAIYDISSNLLNNINDTSNIISLDITSNYDNISNYLRENVSNIASTLSEFYSQVKTRVDELTLDDINISADTQIKYIVDNVYASNLTVSNLRVSGNVVPYSNNTYTLGTSNCRWKDVYLSGNTIYLGDAKISVTSTGGIEILNSQDEYYDIVVSQVVVQDIQTGTLTTIQSAGNQINLESSVTNPDPGQSTQPTNLEKTLYLDEIVEGSNEFYTDAKAGAIVGSSNTDAIGYVTTINANLTSILNQLTTDKIPAGSSNQYIVSGVFPADLQIKGTLTASNLDIKGAYTYISTVEYDTEALMIDTNATDGPALQIMQYGGISDIVQLYGNNNTLQCVISSNGNVGIGTQSPQAQIDLVGNLKASGKINSISSTEINYLTGLRNNVQLQISNLIQDTSNYTSNVNTELLQKQNNNSNITNDLLIKLNSNTYLYFDKSSNQFSSNIDGTSNSIVNYQLLLNSNLLRHFNTNVSNVFNISIPDMSSKLNSRIDSITCNLNSYIINTSNALENAIRTSLNPITSRINTITSTEWVSISGANGTSNTYYMNNIGIGTNPSGAPNEKISVQGNIKFSGSLNYTSSNELNYLSQVGSNIQQQINIVSSNLLSYTSNTSNAFIQIFNATSNNIINFARPLNSNFIGYTRSTSNILAAQLQTTSNALNTTYNRFLSQGYSPGLWSNVTSNIYYLRGNIGIGTSNISTSNELEILSGDMMITGGDLRRTYTQNYILNPVIWYQFNEDPVNTSNIVDYNNFITKYNISVKLFYEFNTDVTNLIVWYKFEPLNSLLDSSGNNVNLYSPTNVATIDTVDYVKNYGSAMFFNTTNNGKSNTLDISDSTTLTNKLNLYNQWLNNGLSFSFWIKLNSHVRNAAYYYWYVFYYKTSINSQFNNNYIQIYKDGNGSLIFRIYNYTLSSALQYSINLTSNVWYHIVWIISSSGVWSFYINNVFTNPSITHSIPQSTSVDQFKMADLNYSTTETNLWMKIDDFRIYKIALTTDQVSSLYNNDNNTLTLSYTSSTNYTFLDTTDLVAWYRFDSSTGITADSSGKNNTLSQGGTFNGSLNTSIVKRGDSAYNVASTGYLTIANDGKFSPNNFTIVFWCKVVRTDNTGTVQTLISCRSYGTTPLYGWSFNIISQTDLYFNANVGRILVSKFAPLYGSYDFATDTFATVSNWKHVALTLSKPSVGNSTVNIYIDGILVDSFAIEYYNYTTGFFTIGAYYQKGISTTNYEYPLSGTMLDDMRFYNRVLSQDEIKLIIGLNPSTLNKNTGNTNNSYVYTNSLTWNGNINSLNDNIYLEYLGNVENIRLLLNTFHVTNAFSIHFVFMTTNITVVSPIFFIGNNTNDFIRIYIDSNVFKFQVGNAIVSMNILSNNYYIIDLTYTVLNNNIVLNLYSNGSFIQTNNQNAYNNLFASANINTNGLVYYIGRYTSYTSNDATPVTLQDFRIFNSVLSAREILVLQQGATTYTISYNEKYSLERWQSSPTYYNFGGTRYITYTEGNVGIGTTNPLTKLHIGPGIISSNISMAYFNSNTALTTASTLNNICSIFDSSIWCKSTIAAASDSRIKTNINDINDQDALNKIMAIEPKTYNYIDPLKGTDTIYGFLAQQIRSVIPEAVSLRKETIPNIFTVADCINPTTILLPLSSPILSKNQNITIIDISGFCDTYIITNIQDNSFTIDKPIYNSPKVFVYGTEVNDFHTLDKQYIYTLNVCATQILSRDLDELENRIKILEEQYNISDTDYQKHI